MLIYGSDCHECGIHHFVAEDEAILGNTFMRGYNVAFDATDLHVGFADINSCPLHGTPSRDREFSILTSNKGNYSENGFFVSSLEIFTFVVSTTSTSGDINSAFATNRFEIFRMADLVFSTNNSSDQYYARSSCKEAHELKHHIIGLYGLESSNMVDLAPSGMGAISAVFHAFSLLAITKSKEASRGLTIIYDQELYCDTLPLFSLIQSLHEPFINLVKTDCTNITTMRKEIQMQRDAYQGHTIVVFAESCSNPTGRIFCFEQVERLKKDFEGSRLYFVIDNTWTTALGINPFNYDVDVVIESCTKYLSGGRAIGGVVLSPQQDLMAEIQNWRRLNGIHVSIANTTEILNGIHDLQSRMHTASTNCMELMRALATKGVTLTHPCVGDHPSRARNKKFGLLQFAPPVFIARIPAISKKQLKSKVSAMKNVEWKTSYGSVKFLVDSYPVIHDSFTEIRIAAGYDNIDVAKVAEELQALL
jgi:cystathionine beta-lyase/cystathionine gamma-synthase